MIIYRVVIKVGYYSAYFEFDTPEKACRFATSALTHNVSNEDTSKKSSITLEIVDSELEAKENEEVEENDV